MISFEVMRYVFRSHYLSNNHSFGDGLVVNEIYSLRKSFPSYLTEDIEILCKENPLLPFIHDKTKLFDVTVNNEILSIPNRIYLSTYPDFDKLSSIQKNIIDCYYTRHHDGFVREKSLKNVITLNVEWVVPYVIKLLGEYVVEILNVIYNEREFLDINLYKNFIKNNSVFYHLTIQRVYSYWSCYYRRYKYKKDYVGFKILNFIDPEFLL